MVAHLQRLPSEGFTDMIKCFCYGCGVEKDPTAKEMYLGEDLCNDEPIGPLLVLDCQPHNFDDPNWKSVIVCFECFDKLSPDMWISQCCWESLNPFVPFEQLPNLSSQRDWDPVQIEENRLNSSP